MNNNNTHLLQNFPSKKRSVLSRTGDGMILAVREGLRVAWGEDPRNQDQRAFIDENYATIFLRRLADADQQARKGMICKDCGYAPAQSITCSGNEDGSHRIEYGGVARIEESDGEPRVRVN